MVLEILSKLTLIFPGAEDLQTSEVAVVRLLIVTDLVI